MKAPVSSGLMMFLLAALLLGFAFGMFGLFAVRFEVGDAYPAYSSLRSDPLGSKAFYDGLAGLHRLSVSRNYGPESGLKGSQSPTIFYIGTRNEDLGRADAEDMKALEALIMEGANVAVLLYPEDARAAGYGKEQEERKKKEDFRKERPCGPGADRAGKRNCPVSLSERWGFDLAYFESSEGGAFKREGRPSPEYALPPASWHSALYFEKLDDRWRKVYTVDDRPVLIERDFGKGKLVLATDSYFTSNEAMRRERHPELLSWLVGRNERVVFDETHLGVRESPGIAALARKYRLHGLFAGMILLGVLFVWKSSYSLVPPRTEDPYGREAYASTGKDSFSGFVSLLRRNVPQRDVLAACLEQWRKTFPRRAADHGAGFKKARSVIEAQRGGQKEKDLVRTYRQIAEIISERTHDE